MLSWLPSAFAGLSAVVGARDSLDEASYSSSMLGVNASLARKQAEDAVSRGESSAMRAKVAARSMVGSQRAALAAQGIDIGSGSALDVQTNTAALAEIDIMTIRNNAAREAWGFNVQAADYGAKASLTKMAGKNKARTTLLTGGATALHLWGGK